MSWALTRHCYQEGSTASAESPDSLASFLIPHVQVVDDVKAVSVAPLKSAADLSNSRSNSAMPLAEGRGIRATVYRHCVCVSMCVFLGATAARR